MADIIVKTDNKWKQFKTRDEVPKKVLADQFDYQRDVYDGFFKYNGHWYHLDQFMRLDVGGPLSQAGWQDYSSDSFSTGVLIKISPGGEEYIAGSYRS